MYIYSFIPVCTMRKITHALESLKTVGGVVDVFETCIDFGLTLTDAKKIAQKWQSQKCREVPGVHA